MSAVSVYFFDNPHLTDEPFYQLVSNETGEQTKELADTINGDLIRLNPKKVFVIED